MTSEEPTQKPSVPLARLRSLGGFLLLLAVLMPWKLWRASLLSGLWIDENYSLLVAHRSFGYLVGITTVDAHPPGFYILLKLWLGLESLLGLEKTILWARLISVFGWLWMAALGWFGGRWLLGRQAGTLFAWMFSGSAMIAYIARDLRNYSLATAAMLTCFLLLLAIYRLEREGHLGRRRSLLLWTAYWFCASLGLWLHLLTSLVLFMLGLAWIALAVRARRPLGAFTLGGAIAQAAAILCFLPWLLRLRYQLEYLADAATPWMSEPNFHNWLGVFTFWYPHGRLGGKFSEWIAQSDLVLAATAFVLAPLAAGLLSGLARRARHPNRFLFYGAAAGTLIPLGNITAQWFLSHYDIAKVFHGERYTVFTQPMWVFGLVCWATIAVRRWRLSYAWAWLLFVPWIVASLHGQRISHRYERDVGLTHSIWRVRNHLPPEDEPIYIMPSALLPYFDGLFPSHETLPIERLADLDESIENIYIFADRSWTHIHQASDRVAGGLIRSGALAESIDSVNLPLDGQWVEYSLYRIDGLRHDLIERILESQRVQERPKYAGAVAVALPESQIYVDGFSVLEIPREGEPFAWGSKAITRIRFDRPLESGPYILHLEIFRQPYPEEEVEMTFRFRGEDTTYRRTVPAGTHTLEVPIELQTGQREVILEAGHPTWKPSEYMEGSTDERDLTFLFSTAWIEPADKST